MDNNKPFVVAISVLGVLIFGLVIGNVILLNKKVETEPEETEMLRPTDSGMSAADEAIESDFVNYTIDLDRKLQEAVDSDPIDTKTAAKLLNDGIDKALESDKRDYAITYIMLFHDKLVEKGQDKFALEELLKLDYTPYTEPAQYRLYAIIIKLAEKTGDSEALSEYKAKQNTVAEAYWTDYRRTEDAVKNFKNEQLEMIKEKSNSQGEVN